MTSHTGGLGHLFQPRSEADFHTMTFSCSLLKFRVVQAGFSMDLWTIIVNKQGVNEVKK